MRLVLVLFFLASLGFGFWLWRSDSRDLASRAEAQARHFQQTLEEMDVVLARRPSVSIVDRSGPLAELSVKADASRVRIAEGHDDRLDGCWFGNYAERNGTPGCQAPPDDVRSATADSAASAGFAGVTYGYGSAERPYFVEYELRRKASTSIRRVVGPAIERVPAGGDSEWRHLAYLFDRNASVAWRVVAGSALELRVTADLVESVAPPRECSFSFENRSLPTSRSPGAAAWTTSIPRAELGDAADRGLRTVVRVGDAGALHVELFRLLR